MLPGVYDFKLEPFHLIFLGTFAVVALVIGTTLIRALHRSARRLATDGAPPLPRELHGLSLPEGPAYFRNHTWARRRGDGTFEIGFDDLARRVLGGGSVAGLPVVGERVGADGATLTLSTSGGPLPVRLPVAGRVVAVGGAGAGWLLRVAPESGRDAAPVPEEGLASWIRSEIEKLQLLLTPEGALPSLADGGSLLPDLPAALPGADWPRVRAELLSREL
jgi:glycine cleavage system H lipoate-binding protein